MKCKVFLLVIYFPISPLPSPNPAVTSGKRIKSVSFCVITVIVDSFTCKILPFVILALKKESLKNRLAKDRLHVLKNFHLANLLG